MLDLKDKKILYHLDLNSRKPINQIAKNIGLSKDLTNYRLKKLEKEEYVLGYQTIIDFKKLGYLTIRTRITLIDTTPQKEKEIIDFLIKQKKVFFILELEGTELTFGLMVKEIEELHEFYKEFETKFKKFLSEKKFAIYSNLYHFNRNYLGNFKEKNTLKLGFSKKEKVDELDLKILKILSKNARTPTIEIAISLKVPATTVAHRIKQLENKKLIVGYSILFNFYKWNYNYFKVNLELKEISNIQKIIDYCESNKNIIYAMQTLGGNDLEIYFESAQEDLIKTMNELRTLFPEIRKWNYDILKKYHKFNYLID